MNTELVRTLTTTFEGHAQKTESGVEYWLARDLQVLLGYAEWRNFTAVINKAKTACGVSAHGFWAILLRSTKWLISVREASEK